jgi:macrodomain Ter protein organizer (MatP/YcbG family)
MMQTVRLTVDLDKAEIDFLKKYARNHGKTISEIINQFITGLKGETQPEIHPEIEKITGILPEDIDFREEYSQYILQKHQ